MTANDKQDSISVSAEALPDGALTRAKGGVGYDVSSSKESEPEWQPGNAFIAGAYQVGSASTAQKKDLSPARPRP